VPPLCSYWINQLINDLTNTPNRSYIILSGGITGADWTVTGEIVEVAGVVRVYTRLVRSENRAVEGAYYSDFERTAALGAMLSSGAASSASGSDEWEPDSFENPVPYEIGQDEESALVVNRAIQPAGDEDFFILTPDRDGRLIAETTGSTDTYIEFYDAVTKEKLTQDDDGGQGTNARIRYDVEAGRHYIVKVRGYNNSTTGNYSFRAYYRAVSESGSSWNNPIVYEPGANEDDSPVIERELGDDGDDFFLIVPESDGRLTMETTGNDLDTYMEFYDADTRQMLAEDDDSGSGYNARIRQNVEAGKRYIVKIYGYGGEGGRYRFRAYIAVQVRLEPDEYENDDDPSRASVIEIGTPQRHTFHTPDDVDWVKFQVTQPGRYAIRTRGVNSNRLDTYIELFDANLNSIAEDDDGGENLDSLISRNLDAGLYYLKVWCLNEPDQPYTIRIDREGN
jgi:hypothetical protein